MSKLNQSEQLQKEHFDAIAAKYAAHYGDFWSQQYRRKFINGPLLDKIDLAGARVVDALCGSGETTAFLLERGASVTGVDISRQEIQRYRAQFPSCEARCASILSTGLDGDAYDCVVVVGGLHHLHPAVSEAVGEIHRILKIGGHFCFAEPHQGSLPDKLRKLWYRSDSLFAENEAAIDLTTLKAEFSGRFAFLKEEYRGNLAYLLVLNSMVFRLPLWTKRLYSPPLMLFESLFERIQTRRTSCYVICQWRKV